MEKKEFFINEETRKGKVDGQEFEYKPLTGGDELDWHDDYTETHIEKDDDGNEIKVRKSNIKKLAFCKLRNITKIPFNKEEIKGIIKIEKEYPDLSNDEKDSLFNKLDSKILQKLIDLVSGDLKSKKN